ncbi:hypothetical protein DdX_01774 [Ditylenchus destructor]|uniref:Uncharacterized protein n=1 Tax=Ditylenchus destructor TaxID=166010 RepID=A0AAD4RBG2_9BILA|nr:hypothetical protein DdX_01774 [Ditylenchus destructor]
MSFSATTIPPATTFSQNYTSSPKFSIPSSSAASMKWTAPVTNNFIESPVSFQQRPRNILTLQPPNYIQPTQKPVPIQKRRPVSANSNSTSLQTKGAAVLTSDNFKAVSNVSDTRTECACICERPAGMIICRRCGSELLGRVQQACPAHPKRINLMDHRECVKAFCRSIQLTEVPLQNSEAK